MSNSDHHAAEQEREHSAKVRQPESEATTPVHEVGPAALFGSLQRSAGNAAVNHLLRQYAAQRATSFPHAPAPLLRHTLGSTLARSALPQQEPAPGGADQSQPTPEENLDNSAMKRNLTP